MNRKGFLKRIGLGALIAPAFPFIIQEVNEQIQVDAAFERSYRIIDQQIADRFYDKKLDMSKYMDYKEPITGYYYWNGATPLLWQKRNI